MFECEAQKGSRGRDEKYEGECHTTASICPGYKTEGSSCPDLTIREASVCSVQYVGSRGWEGLCCFFLELPSEVSQTQWENQVYPVELHKIEYWMWCCFLKELNKNVLPRVYLEQLYTLYIEQLQDKLLIKVHQSSIN